MATAGGVILFLASDFGARFAGSILLFAGLAGIGPTLDARTLETLGPAARERYGQVRAFGSLAFVVAALLVGLLLDARGSRALFWVYLPCLLAHGRRDRHDPRAADDPLGQPAARRRPILGGPGRARSSSAVSPSSGRPSPRSTRSTRSRSCALGGEPGLVGIAWAFGAVVEVPLMYVFPRLGPASARSACSSSGRSRSAPRGPPGRRGAGAAGARLVAPLEGVGFALLLRRRR